MSTLSSRELNAALDQHERDCADDRRKLQTDLLRAGVDIERIDEILERLDFIRAGFIRSARQVARESADDSEGRD